MTAIITRLPTWSVVWFAAGLGVNTALATEPPAPSIDLLLYLADWEPDAQGRLTDPLEVPAETESPTETADTNRDPVPLR